MKKQYLLLLCALATTQAAQEPEQPGAQDTNNLQQTGAQQDPMTEMMKMFQQMMREQNQRHDNIMTQLRQDHNNTLQQQNQRYDDMVRQLRQDHNNTLQQQDRRHDDMARQLRQDHNNTLQQQNQRFNTMLQNQVQQIANLHQQNNQTLIGERKQHKRELKQQRKRDRQTKRDLYVEKTWQEQNRQYENARHNQRHQADQQANDAWGLVAGEAIAVATIPITGLLGFGIAVALGGGAVGKASDADRTANRRTPDHRKTRAQLEADAKALYPSSDSDSDSN